MNIWKLHIDFGEYEPLITKYDDVDAWFTPFGIQTRYFAEKMVFKGLGKFLGAQRRETKKLYDNDGITTVDEAKIIIFDRWVDRFGLEHYRFFNFCTEQEYDEEATKRLLGFFRA